MINLDFLINEYVITEDKLSDPLNSDVAVLQETFFVQPVRFIINNTDLFARFEERNIWINSPEGQTYISKKKEKITFLSLPLLNISIVGLEKVRKVCEGKKILYLLPGMDEYIEFRSCNAEMVEVTSSFINTAEKISYDELIYAFEEFENKVRSFINKEFPELKAHPQLGRWLLYH